MTLKYHEYQINLIKNNGFISFNFLINIHIISDEEF